MSTRPLRIDLNCDVGESFGAWRLGDDEALLQHVTSANIACGFHAGDPATMRRTIELAMARGVAIGAHPGLPDLAGFGRRVMQLEPEEVYDLVVYQIGALTGIAHAAGAVVTHVKPHGALYNMAARNPALAAAIAKAVHDVDRSTFLVGLAGSQLVTEAERLGLRGVHEVFADRSYEADGSLTPRSHSNALVEDAEAASDRAVQMVREGWVKARTGENVRLRAETICVHGDGKDAAAIAKRLRSKLEAAGAAVCSLREV